MPTEPTTAAEWQAAVDTAHASLILDAARKYELVIGGPNVNVERCEEILRRGATLGHLPADGAVENFLAGLMAEGLADTEKDN